MSSALRLCPADHRVRPLPDGPRRLYRDAIVDSGNWDLLALRAGDIVISSAGPRGADWMQHILLRLVRRGQPGQEFSPWVDQAGADMAAIGRMLDAVPHRRVLSSRLPLDGLPFREDLTYVVVTHDPRDALISRRHGTDAPASPDDRPAGDPFRHIAGWWPHRRLENLHFVHARDLREDTVTEVAALAERIGLGLRLTQARAIAAETALRANWHHGPDARATLDDAGQRSYEATRWSDLSPACVDFVERGRRALW